MSVEGKTSTITAATGDADTAEVTPATVDTSELFVEQERSEKILKAKELYSHGSRNFLVKCYAEAADELSEVCGLYEELYGELSDELGMPYLLYAKSLIALALDENKVIDVPDVEEDDDDDEDVDDNNTDDGDEADKKKVVDGVKAESEANGEAAAISTTTASEAIVTSHTTPKVVPDTAAEATTTTTTAATAAVAATTTVKSAADEPVSSTAAEKTAKMPEHEKPKTIIEEAEVSSSNDDNALANAQKKPRQEVYENGAVSTNGSKLADSVVADGEKPTTSNGEAKTSENDAAAGEAVAADGAANMEDEVEAASSLQLAWEILELAAKIFSRQGMSGLPNLAEVQTELANIEFENNILESAREDYGKALRIYQELPNSYRRAMAEIHYKIGLTYLMQQLNKEGAESLKEACQLIDGEIEEIKAKTELSDKDKNNIQDMEETKQEIWAKIAEIEEAQALNAAEVRAALDSYIKPTAAQSADGASCSSTSSGTASTRAATSSKPTDISHLIKRKKPEEPSSEAEAVESPAKRAAL